ncbi:TPA: hypothetical protein DDZ01_03555 [Candidatus Uhrbacteria bacterium]|nr:MAG: hypothetical protein UT94_C0002G0047 [Candidatus Uhrbacteria bacterium GW2011_GWF2_40_263]OGL97369.1 MAG: hypothetical protein A2332_04590 [Candidatus Uhrbacteria bacterium RIFOXYB2_FULL_41_18]HBK35043.1 hypothetical protein [Candidatus Uhrbacteria bacterium]HCB56196.1 hypothetical protein [Candidatus Uhrbacteria bacterium]
MARGRFDEDGFDIPIKKIVIGIITVVVLIVGAVFSGNLVESVDANEIVIMQDPVDGELHYWIAPGLYYQNFGRTTHYLKSNQYWFSSDQETGNGTDQSIPVRFNDGGTATISGSIRFELPLSEEALKMLHTKYGSMHAIERDLIGQIVNKAVFMSGPLMSSKESYAERKTELIQIIGDQISNGVYQTHTVEVEETDPLTETKRVVSKVDLVPDESGGYKRQEESPLHEFGIRAFNFTVNEVKYDAKVEAQIQRQQDAIMEVQSAIADAKKADQNAKTVTKQGEAEAAKAKWDQEVIKAKAVTEAEQKKEVAKLDMEAAEFYKKEQILIGEGDAERKRLVMSADGALEQKLAAYIEVQKAYAEQLGKQRWVPEIQMGGSSSGGGEAAMSLVDLLTAQTARDLNLDLRQRKQ